MQARLKNILLISIPAVIFSLLLLEIGLRLFILVSDKPLGEYDQRFDIIRFQPNQNGRSVLIDTAAEFRINASGWNSPHEYHTERQANELRIAVIGDSYVEAFQVDYDRNFAAILYEALDAELSNPVTVYSFGTSGAPASQYLQMMRYVSEVFAPDIYIINLVHNDFSEMLRSRRNAPVFLQLALDANNEILEIPPAPQNRTLTQKLIRVGRVSYLARYLGFNLGLDLKLAELLNPQSTITLPVEVSGQLTPEGDIPDDIRRATDYVFNQYNRVANQSNANILLIIDAPRRTIYAGRNLNDDPNYVYNLLAAEFGIPLVDLTSHFQRDYEQNRQRFEFARDGHWNGYAHNLVGQIVAEELAALGWLD